MPEAAAEIVSLRPVTYGTVREIIALSVGEQQAPYVAPNATSISEGLLNPGGWLRAVYAGDTPVGFVMLFDPKVPGAIVRSPVGADAVMLWRLMIDRSFQKRGFGASTLELACTEAREMGARELLTSFVPGPCSPERFYLRHGFTPTGRFRAGGTQPELSRPLDLG